jgi:hypothetical protein
MRLVQIRADNTRRVAIVEEPRLRLLGDCESVCALVEEALVAGSTLAALAQRKATQELLDYEPIYAGVSPWRLLPPVDHPREPARCLVSGTGLTHLGSARERQIMHAKSEELTDSMKMFRWGIEGGRPAEGQIGAAPEWFYKGTGAILRAHGEGLEIPAHAEDGGEEAEVASIYFVDSAGVPRRVGMAAGNEFSDHKFEKKNYLNLASSKLRTCAIGPELVLDADFQSVPGEVVIERGASVLWSKQIRTGEAEMCHSLRNIEHHHFKFDAHRRPGDVHVHFLGADCLSFGEGVELRDGDVMQVRFEGFGRALRNPLRVVRGGAKLVNVVSIG